jgi:hypothetical protein
MMCKIWCSVGDGRCWHILPTLQILPSVINGWLHAWKNIFGENNLNQKRVLTLLSLQPYILWARTNTELQLIVYHIHGQSVWTLLVIALSRGYVCNHPRISIVLLSCISYTKLLKWPS